MKTAHAGGGGGGGGGGSGVSGGGGGGLSMVIGVRMVMVVVKGMAVGFGDDVCANHYERTSASILNSLRYSQRKVSHIYFVGVDGI